MIVEKHSTAVSVESAGHTPEPARVLRAPGRHTVKILGWDYLDHGDEHDVVFEVSDDHGRRQGVLFGLRELELGSGELTRFITTVLGLQPPAPDGIPPHLFRQMQFNQLVGRRVVLEVVTTSRGVPIVIDWEAVSHE